MLPRLGKSLWGEGNLAASEWTGGLTTSLVVVLRPLVHSCTAGSACPLARGSSLTQMATGPREAVAPTARPFG